MSLFALQGLTPSFDFAGVSSAAAAIGAVSSGHVFMCYVSNGILIVRRLHCISTVMSTAETPQWLFVLWPGRRFLAQVSSRGSVSTNP